MKMSGKDRKLKEALLTIIVNSLLEIYDIDVCNYEFDMKLSENFKKFKVKGVVKVEFEEVE